MEGNPAIVLVPEVCPVVRVARQSGFPSLGTLPQRDSIESKRGARLGQITPILSPYPSIRIMTNLARKKRVLSGMRSTGKLHLGNYVGALANWVKMQDEYESFHFIADWHALTTDYADTSRVKENSVEVMLDWLAAGLDPEKCVM